MQGKTFWKKFSPAPLSKTFLKKVFEHSPARPRKNFLEVLEGEKGILQKYAATLGEFKQKESAFPKHASFFDKAKKFLGIE